MSAPSAIPFADSGSSTRTDDLRKWARMVQRSTCVSKSASRRGGFPEISKADMCDGTIFIDACRDGDVEKVRSMLEAKPGLVRYVEPFMHNYTPLHYAAKKGTLDVVKILVDSGANINALTTFKYTALHLAAMGGKESVILYLEKQPDVKLDTRDVSGQTYEDYWGRPVGTKKPVEANRDERGADDKANASQGHGKKKPSAPRRLLKRVVPCCSGPSDSA